MKALIVIDLPDDADVEKARANINVLNIDDKVWMYYHCPLKPVPEKSPFSYKEKTNTEWYEVMKFAKAFNQGWNNCIDLITEVEDESSTCD